MRKKSKIATQTIRFIHNGFEHVFTFTPEESDWWISFYENNTHFDVHYCEDYNHICVYEYDPVKEKTIDITLHEQKIK